MVAQAVSDLRRVVKMFTKLKYVVLTAIVLGTTSLAAAQAPAPAPGARHAERKAKLLEKFDTNKNGTLDPAEKEAMHEQRARTMFGKLDANGDGKLTFEEFKAAKHGKFGRHHGRRGKGPGRGL
ncbi:MAG TPA: EF-hand domain-containing protein [Kofleriaceae bacterium]|nr:EF-hand domain-containing protein [Kofleriaceae bacterium]